MSAPIDDEVEPEEFREQDSRRKLVEWALWLLGLAVMVLVLRTYVVGSYYIPSVSMEPDFEIGDRLLANKLDRSPERGEVVVFSRVESFGTDVPDDIVKRVIAVEGDVVAARNNRVLVNGQPIDEPYLAPGTITNDFDPVTVPADELFVMGDNRERSDDSRFNGTIPAEAVVGVVFIHN